jgi:hypothetical protein
MKESNNLFNNFERFTKAIKVTTLTNVDRIECEDGSHFNAPKGMFKVNSGVYIKVIYDEPTN